jgi:DNA modification methylase
MRNKCVWSFRSVGSRRQRRHYYDLDCLEHPAKMPTYLVDAILDAYCLDRDWVVLDPMCGIGTTLIQCARKGIQSIGIELEARYVNWGLKSIRKAFAFTNSGIPGLLRFRTPILLRGDARSMPLRTADTVVTSPPYSGVALRSEGEHGAGKYLPGDYGESMLRQKDDYKSPQDSTNISRLPYGKMVDVCLTSSPYGNRLSDDRTSDSNGLARELNIPPVMYSQDKENIGTQRGGTYLEAMFIVYREIYRVLKPHGFMILVIKNFVRDRKIVRLDLDTMHLCESIGFRMLPCPENCGEIGHTHLHRLKTHSFWIRNIIRKWYATECLAALGFGSSEELWQNDLERNRLTRRYFSTARKPQNFVKVARETDPDLEIRSCPYEEASRFEQIQVYRKETAN